MIDLDVLSRALYRLESRADWLDDLLVPRTPSSGENAGKAPSVAKSRPPLSVGIVDLKSEVESVLGLWCGELVAACPQLGPAPSGRRASERAAWLRSHVLDLERMPWCELMCDEVRALASLVDDVVDPPPSASDPQPPEFGTDREIARWSKHLGWPVSRSTIRRAAQDGKIQAQRLPDGRVLVSLKEVLALVRPAALADD